MALAFNTYAQSQQPPVLELDTGGNVIRIDTAGTVLTGGNAGCAAGATCRTTSLSVGTGTVSWAGEIGTFTVSLTARSKPLTGAVPRLDVVIHRLQTTVAESLVARWTDTGFTPSGGGTVVSGSGTITDGSVRASLHLDNANAPFGGPYYNGVGPFTATPFNATVPYPVGPASSPFSMTLVLAFKLGANSSSTGDFSAWTTPPLGSVGDFVWQDNNGNGVQDPGEPGINGVTVRLRNSGGTVVATTATQTNGAQTGYYLFPNLPAGTYTVEVDAATLPAGFTATVTGAGTPSTDSNGSPAPVTLAAGENNVTIDFGYVPPCTGVIGDFVWNDANRNGIQDAGEAGLPNVRVFLRRGSDPVREATTLASGAFEFTGVCAGTYTVEVDASTLPPTFVPTTSNAPGSNTNNDSNGSPASVVLNSYNSVDRSIDFGYYSACSASIGDFLWHDMNRNGIQDAGEPGLNGILVQLRNTAGTVIASTTTAANPHLPANGYYQFSGLCAGTYAVTYDAATVPAGFQPTTAGGVPDPNIDSNAVPATVVLAANNSTDQSIDFGFRVPCSGKIGDFVWVDLNRNGVQDSTEPGFGSVIVNLYRASDNAFLATTTTNAAGAYEFTGLCAGEYRVAAVPPTGYASSPTGAGTTATDSNANPSPVSLAADNSVDTTVDFGFYAGALGDRVWNDANANGVQDPGEAGLVGWAVTLRDSSGTVIASTSTGADGIYGFTGLLAGAYSVCVTPMAGYIQTYDLDGIATPHCAAAPLTAGQVRLDVDFGYYVPASLGDRVWNDVNSNGVQDAGEAGLTGWTVTLRDSGGNVVASMPTGANGIYGFSGLRPGAYSVCVSPMTGYIQTYDLDGLATPHCAAASLVAGQNRTDVDFGYYLPPPANLGDWVWHDLNANGQQDAGEPGVANVTVQLYACGSNALLGTAVTNGTGYYGFLNLAAGCYYVKFTAPAGYVFTRANLGGDATDSDASQTTGVTGQYTLAAGQTDNTVDAGLLKTGMYRTGTQGGWGQDPAGNNVGALLQANFATLYPRGLTVGGRYTIRYTSAAAVRGYLPTGGTPGVLIRNYTDPTGDNEAGIFAGQVTALTLNVAFSNAGLLPAGLANLRVAAGRPLAGYTVAQVLALAQRVLGGETTALPAGMSVSGLNEVVDAFNNNFVDGTSNDGWLY